MKWFKHLSSSLNESFVFGLVERFGGDGYMAYFGILEMLSDEFDIHNPGENMLSLKKITKNLQLSRQKTVKILEFCDQKAKGNSQKKLGFYVTFKKDHVVINCPRLKELADEYTQKQLKDLSGQCRDNVGSESGQTPVQETEVETEVERKAFLSEKQPEAAHFSNKVGEEYRERIIELCQKLRNKTNGKTRFNPWQWVQLKFNVGPLHPQAIIDALEGLLKYWDGLKRSPWAYADSIFKTRNQNYNEAEQIQEHEKLKNAIELFEKTDAGKKIGQLLGTAIKDISPSINLGVDG